MDQKLYDSYVKILKNELVPALGCTEPIAIAYAAAAADTVYDTPTDNGGFLPTAPRGGLAGYLRLHPPHSGVRRVPLEVLGLLEEMGI